MSRMLLVEDDKSLGSTLSERLTKEGFVVDWVETLAKAREKVSAGAYDLLILDIGLSDGSGFDFAKEIRAESSLPIIFVTAQSGAEDRLRGYEIGAEEFIPKPFHLRELLLRVKHVLDNHALPDVVVFEDVKIDFQAMTITVGAQSEALNQREVQVLKYLIEKSPRVISRDELLDHIWGKDEFPSNRTVDNVMVRLRQALGENKNNWIRSVRGVGYQWQAIRDNGEK